MAFKIKRTNAGNKNKNLTTSAANRDKTEQNTSKVCGENVFQLTSEMKNNQEFYDSNVQQEYYCAVNDTVNVHEVNQMTTYYPQYYAVPMCNIPVLIPADWNDTAIAIKEHSGITDVVPLEYIPDPYGTILYTEDEAACSYVYAPETNYIEETQNDIHYQNETGYETVPDDYESIDISESKPHIIDPIELFITLPKELFPPAKSKFINPNSIIDQFCKLPNINITLSWVLDIEFGLPREPVPRSIAVYNVMNNHIFCKNSSKAHPGFEACGSPFKDFILDYYNKVMYQWYKGYVIINHDKCLENFQTWLLLPMQLLGMAWR